MIERTVIPDTVFLGKLADRWVNEFQEAEGFRVFEMKPGQVFDIGVERRLRRVNKPLSTPPDAA